MTAARFDGKVAVVTGAGRGVGRAVAEALAARGASVVLNDTGVARDGASADPAVVDAAVEALRASGARAEASAHDVSTEEGARAMVDVAVRAFGGVDALVTCAGVIRDRPFTRMDEASLDAVMRAQVYGTFHACRAASRRMIDQRRGGRIVTTVGAAGYFGALGQSNLAAALGAVHGLTRSMAVELKKHAVYVNAVAPVARTRMTEDLPMFEALGDETYGPRFVAPAVVFLASTLAGELTGEVLSVAGTRLSLYRVQESVGVVGDDPRTPWTPEAVRSQWERLARYR